MSDEKRETHYPKKGAGTKLREMSKKLREKRDVAPELLEIFKKKPQEPAAENDHEPLKKIAKSPKKREPDLDL
ncbi:hypothetical protein WDW86_18650 [Bdellovibrionota bacterium FG-2]